MLVPQALCSDVSRLRLREWLRGCTCILRPVSFADFLSFLLVARFLNGIYCDCYGGDNHAHIKREEEGFEVQGVGRIEWVGLFWDVRPAAEAMTKMLQSKEFFSALQRFELLTSLSFKFIGYYVTIVTDDGKNLL
jgi:hypothetical protein